MHALRLAFVFLIVTFLSFLLGCSQESIPQVEQNGSANEDTQAIIELRERQIQELADQVEKFKHQNMVLEEEINGLEEEKRQFLTADRFGRMLYQAMVFGDTEKLKDLTTASNLQVFDNRFELQVDEELVKTPFSGLQTESHRTNQAILKANGFGLDHDKQIMRIHYTIIEPESPEDPGMWSEYFLNVNLVKVGTLEWSVDHVEFDI